jgi:hypothetical protein
MMSLQLKMYLERAGLLFENESELLEESGLHGSIRGTESYKAISHFKGYVAPYLSKEEVKKAKKQMERFGNVSNVKEEDGEFSGKNAPDKEGTHELNTKHEDYPSGTKIKVFGLHHIDDNGKIYLHTSHGVIPQSKLKKPEQLRRENKSVAGFDVEGKIAKNLGGVPAGSTGTAHDFSYGKNPDGSSTVRGKTHVIEDTSKTKKALKTDDKPVVAGESKLTNVKMGAGGLKWNKQTGWSFSSKHKEFEKHINENAKVHQEDGSEMGLIEHLNKHHPNGVIDKGFTIKAPAGSARSYFRSTGANALHVHDKKTDKGTTFTVGDDNELKGKTKLGHLSNSDMDENLDGVINVEATKTGAAALYHRPNAVKMRHLAALSTIDSEHHRDLTNPEHAGEFMNHVDNHIQSLGKKPKTQKPTKTK